MLRSLTVLFAWTSQYRGQSFRGGLLRALGEGAAQKDLCYEVRIAEIQMNRRGKRSEVKEEATVYFAESYLAYLAFYV